MSMNPMHLLAVGDSVDSAREASGRYRLPKRNPLPQFGSPKNPFTVAKEASRAETGFEERPNRPVITTAEPPEPEHAKLGASSPERVKPEQADTEPPGLLPKRSVRVRAMANSALAACGFSVCLGWPERVTRWLAACNPLPRGGTGKPAREPNAFQAAATHFQGEFSLDKVRVVRNDLRDSDLGVVPLRSVTSMKENHTAEDDPAKSAGARAWGRLVGRLQHTQHKQIL